MLINSIALPSQAIIPLGIALAHIALCLYVLFRRQLDDTINQLFIAYLLLTILFNINLVVIIARVSTLLPGFGVTQIVPYWLIILGLVYWAFARAFLQRSWLSPWGWGLALAGLAAAFSLDAGWLLFPRRLWPGAAAGLPRKTPPLFWARRGGASSWR